MGGNGASRTGDIDVLEGCNGSHFFGASLEDGFVATCVSDEDVIKLHAGGIAKLILDVFEQYGGKFTAVFFANTHLTLVNGDAGLKL